MMSDEMRCLTAEDIAWKQHIHVAFVSPDSSHLYYSANDSGSARQTLYRADVSDGRAHALKTAAADHAQWVALWRGGMLDVLCERDWSRRTATFFRITADGALGSDSIAVDDVVDVCALDDIGLVITKQSLAVIDQSHRRPGWQNADLKRAWENSDAGRSTALELLHRPEERRISPAHGTEIYLLRAELDGLRRIPFSGQFNRLICNRLSRHVVVLSDLSVSEAAKNGVHRDHWKRAHLIDVVSQSEHVFAEILSCHTFDWSPSLERIACVQLASSKARLAFIDIECRQVVAQRSSEVPIGPHGAWISGQWLDPSGFVVDGEQGCAGAPGKWVIVNPDGSARTLDIGPREYQAPRRFADAPITVRDGKLFRLGPDLGIAEQLPIPSDLTVEQICWPSRPDTLATRIIFVARRMMEGGPADGSRALYSYSFSDQHTSFLFSADDVWPHIDGQRDAPVMGWVAENANGTTLFCYRDTREREICHVNRHFRHIRRGTGELVEYGSADGAKLLGYVIYPPHLEPVNLPAIVAMFPDFNYYREPPPERAFWSGGFSNLHIAAAHGFVVIVPAAPPGFRDWPTEEFEQRISRDLYAGIAGAVESLVDVLVSRGAIDPNKIAVMGYSRGATAAVRLLADSDRYKAGVVVSPIANTLGDAGYGHHEQRHAYSHLDELRRCPRCNEEDRKPDHFYSLLAMVERSAVRFACAIRSPLLIVQGDQSNVELNHSSTLFEALARLNRTVSLIRYVGEGHGISSPGNTVDFWTRALSWLDAHIDRDGSRAHGG